MSFWVGFEKQAAGAGYNPIKHHFRMKGAEKMLKRTKKAVGDQAVSDGGELRFINKSQADVHKANRDESISNLKDVAKMSPLAAIPVAYGAGLYNIMKPKKKKPRKKKDSA